MCIDLNLKYKKKTYMKENKKNYLRVSIMKFFFFFF